MVRMKLLSRLVPFALAALVILLCFNPLAAAETETETWTGTASTGALPSSQQYLRFSMVYSPVPGASGYPKGNGSAEIQVQGTFLAIHLEAEGMAGGAHLMLVLNANGTSHSVANMTTDHEGEVEAEATFSLPPGTYSAGLKVLDTSTFNSPTVVQVSDPSAATLSTTETTQTTTTTEQQTQSVNPVQGGETEEDGIQSAIQSKFIPAVVDLGESGSTVRVNDGNFSVSVGTYRQNGYLVSISGSNVTGPRVLLVNLTSAQSRSLFSGPVLVSLDGSAVQQAANLSLVLGAKAGDPARFILVSSPSVLSLLISIPHFSYHVVEIIPVLVQVASIPLIDVPVLLLSVAVVSLVVVMAYSRRTRVVA